MTARFPPVPLPDSPFAAQLRVYCLGFPGAYEDYPWGDIVYKVGAKMFASTGPSLPVCVTIKANKDDADVLVGLPNVSRARYVGQHGWVTVLLDDGETWELARDLIADSYDLVVPRTRRRRRSPNERAHGRR